MLFEIVLAFELQLLTLSSYHVVTKLPRNIKVYERMY